MDSTVSAHISRRIIAAINRRQYQQITKRSIPRHLVASSSTVRYASSSSRPPPSSKPIILEQPDKFRPPSHPARLNARKTTATYGAFQGGHNQDATEKEREQQAKRSYPNMFPKQGSFMHWFLTNRGVHLWISLGTLTLLAIFSLSQSFIQTSPFAHLLPSLSSFPYHPITFVKECADVFRLHTDYISQQTARARQDRILDAQKRRIYRRAHGMEDMEAQESQGVDITGLVDWDDGLTNRERERGGRTVFEMERRARRAYQMSEEKTNIGATSVEIAELEDVLRMEEERARLGVPQKMAPEHAGDEEGLVSRPQKKKVKRWFGIWE